MPPPARPRHPHFLSYLPDISLRTILNSEVSPTKKPSEVRLLPPWRKGIVWLCRRKSASSFGLVVFYDTSLCLGLSSRSFGKAPPHSPPQKKTLKSKVPLIKALKNDFFWSCHYKIIKIETNLWQHKFGHQSTVYPYPVGFSPPPSFNLCVTRHSDAFALARGCNSVLKSGWDGGLLIRVRLSLSDLNFDPIGYSLCSAILPSSFQSPNWDRSILIFCIHNARSTQNSFF